MSALITARDVSGRKRIMITQGRGLVIPVPYLPPSPKAHHFRGDFSPCLEPLLSAGGSGLISTHLSSGPALRRDPISPSLNVAVSNCPIETPPDGPSHQQPRALVRKQSPSIAPSLTLACLSSVFLRIRLSKLAALQCGGPQTKRQEMIGQRGGKSIFVFPHWPPSNAHPSTSFESACQRIRLSGH